jgi:Fe-S cluster assembly iron-binding protein IscA
MLQVTESAVSAFRRILDRDDVEGDAIRIAPTMQGDGQVGITLQAVDQPAPEDAPTAAEGLTIVVAPELAPSLDDAVLDADNTEDGAEFFLRAQEPPAS